MMSQTLQRCNVAFLWTFYSKPLIDKTHVIKSGGATRKYNHLEFKYITYRYLMYQNLAIQCINKFKDLKLQDISTIDVIVDLIQGSK